MSTCNRLERRASNVAVSSWRFHLPNGIFSVNDGCAPARLLPLPLLLQLSHKKRQLSFSAAPILRRLPAPVRPVAVVAVVVGWVATATSVAVAAAVRTLFCCCCCCRCNFVFCRSLFIFHLFTQYLLQLQLQLLLFLLLLVRHRRCKHFVVICC